MNEMYRMEDYRDNREDYRDYRDEYRENYRDEYGRNQRDEYGRNRRNYRNYRDYRNYRNYRDEFPMMMEDAIEDTMELARTYEDLSEMTTNSSEKQKLMKIAEREKEHYRTAKEIMEKRM